MPDHDPLDELPGLRAFGAALTRAAQQHEHPAPRRLRGRSLRRGLLAAVLVAGVTGTTATATVLALRASVITAPAPSVVPVEQTPRAEGEQVLALRATDPAGEDPWALRRSTSQTGLTCTTVGQARRGAFGLVGQDGVFRAIPSAVTDACGEGLLLGARVVAAEEPADVRSVISGVVGSGARRVVLRTSSGARALELGPGGSFLAAVRGYPEDQALELALTDARGRTTVHSVGRRASLVPDVGGAPAWRLERLVLGTRALCVHLRDVRPPGPSTPQAGFEGIPGSSTPSTCLDPRRAVTVVADARRLAPGESGVPGFDRWNYRRGRPERTVLQGVARTATALRAVTLLGAPGGPRHVPVSGNGTFAVMLPPSVPPSGLRLRAVLVDGSRRTVIPGRDLVPDLVAARRPR